MCSVRNSPHKRIRVLRRPEIRSILSVTGWPGSEVHTSKMQWGDQSEPLVTDDLRLLLVLSFEEFLLDQENAVVSLKRDLLIFSRLIFESSVCDGSPSLMRTQRKTPSCRRSRASISPALPRRGISPPFKVAHYPKCDHLVNILAA